MRFVYENPPYFTAGRTRRDHIVQVDRMYACWLVYLPGHQRQLATDTPGKYIHTHKYQLIGVRATIPMFSRYNIFFCDLAGSFPQQMNPFTLWILLCRFVFSGCSKRRRRFVLRSTKLASTQHTERERTFSCVHNARDYGLYSGGLDARCQSMLLASLQHCSNSGRRKTRL